MADCVVIVTVQKALRVNSFNSYLFQIVQIIYMILSLLHDFSYWRGWMMNSKLRTLHTIVSHYGNSVAFPMSLVITIMI